jgi:hypothetical protein
MGIFVRPLLLDPGQFTLDDLPDICIGSTRLILTSTLTSVAGLGLLIIYAPKQRQYE